MNRLSFLSLLAVSAVACSAPTTADSEAESAESNLSASGIGEACSAPVRSADGLYAVLDLCPSGDAEGKIVRVELASNATSVVASYPASDRVENLSAQGGSFVFDVLHDVDASGDATRGIDVHAHAWSLASSRSLTTAPIDGVAGDFHRLSALQLTEDGSQIFYAASGAQAGDEELSHRLMVAPASGNGAPVAIDLGADAKTGEMRFSTSADAIVGHLRSLDANNAVGETLYLVDTTGAAGARLTGKRRASLASPALDAALTNKGKRAFDGTRVWGVRAGTNEDNTLVAFEPRSGQEKVLDSGLGLRIVASLGTDVVYATRAETGTGIEVSLKKIPVAGGTSTELAKTTVPSLDHAKVAFDAIAIGSSGAYGIFRTVVATSTPSAYAPFERWLVKLDGSAAAEKLVGTGSSYYGDDVSGDRALYSASHANGQYGRRLVDLATGVVTSAGITAGYTPSVLVGDGSIIEIASCQTPIGTTQLRHITANGTISGPCGRNAFMDSHLTIAGSPAVVFYSERPGATGNRYPVTIVKP